MKVTLAFWLNDESRGKEESWEFLDRRIEDVMTVGKGIGAIKLLGVADILSFMRSRFAA
jgi:ubiquinone biosynthesis protein COQ9